MLFLCLRVLEELIVNRFMYIKTLESVSILYNVCVVLVKAGEFLVIVLDC